MSVMIATLLLAQPATPVVTITPPPRPFDLAAVKPRPSRCQDTDFAAADTEVLVCAGRPKAPAPIAGAAFETGPFVPEVEMLGGKLDVAVEQRGSLMGSAPAAMARFKLKF